MVEISSKEEVTIQNKELQHITALRTNFGQLLSLNSGVLCRDLQTILHTAVANHLLAAELEMVCTKQTLWSMDHSNSEEHSRL
jgi:hypothetical protein